MSTGRLRDIPSKSLPDYEEEDTCHMRRRIHVYRAIARHSQQVSTRLTHCMSPSALMCMGM
jgi:hypothetical protein